MKLYGSWNSRIFALVGGVVGLGYGYFVADVVGLVSYANLSLLVLTMLFSAAMGAILVGGVAATRNFIGHQSERLASWAAQPRKTKNAPAAIKAKPNAVFQLNGSPR